MKRLSKVFILLSWVCLLGMEALAEDASVRSSLTAALPKTLVYDEIPGVDSQLLSLDIYQPAENLKECPVVVFVHGGGWSMGDKQGTDFKDEYFTSQGYVFVSLNYRLSQQPLRVTSNRESGNKDGHQPNYYLPEPLENPVRFPAQPQDVAKGLAWVYRNIAQYGGDPERIGLIGHSAGGHLVCLVSTDGSYLEAEGLGLSIIKGTVDLDAGSLDIKARFPEIKQDHELFYYCILSCFGDDPEVLTMASPTNHVTPDKTIPPLLLVHQKYHEARTRDHQRFWQLLDSQGYNARLLPVALNHGQLNTFIGQVEMGNGGKLSTDKQKEAKRLTTGITEFFREHLR